MPKVVDHASRRKELAGAALAIVRQDGPESLSMRRLAAASGWSSGALRHYVPDVDALAGLLLEQVSARVQAAVTTHLAVSGRNRVTTDAVIACLAEVLPLDPEREMEFAVWRYFWGRDRRGVEAAWVWTGQRMYYRQMVLLLSGVEIRHLSPRPEQLEDGLEAWASHLHAVVDGLALRAGLAVPPPSADEVMSDLRHAVAVIAGALRS